VVVPVETGSSEKGRRIVRRGVVVALALLGAATLLAAACTTEEGDTIVNTPGSTTNGITVSGRGEAFGSPDVALISLGVQAQATTVAEARETSASTAQAVIDSVKKNGVADKDIVTTQFTIQPQYDFRSNGGQTIRGYQVTNVISIKVRKIDTAGKVLDDATAAGGNNTLVQGISFTIDDPSKLQEAARADALKDAQDKAEQLAKNAGVKLGKPMAISESTGSTPIPYAAETARAAADTVTPIQTGDLQVTISVQVLYAIE
jgi:uncharacterized protein YggE